MGVTCREWGEGVQLVDLGTSNNKSTAIYPQWCTKILKRPCQLEAIDIPNPRATDGMGPNMRAHIPTFKFAESM